MLKPRFRTRRVVNDKARSRIRRGASVKPRFRQQSVANAKGKSITKLRSQICRSANVKVKIQDKENYQ